MGERKRILAISTSLFVAFIVDGPITVNFIFLTEEQTLVETLKYVLKGLFIFFRLKGPSSNTVGFFRFVTME